MKIGYFHEIGKSQKSVVRKDRRSVFGRFSAKNIPLKNDENSMKSVNPKSPWLGRTEGPCSDTFQPKIFRLKFNEIQ
jgi:hypothetical protein